METTAQSKRQRHVIGATVVFRPVPGLTTAELQRLVDCHLARNATLGYDTATAEMEHCLLTQRGVQASVRVLERGFAVDVRAEDAFAGQEIWRRAQALASGRTQPRRRHFDGVGAGAGARAG